MPLCPTHKLSRPLTVSHSWIFYRRASLKNRDNFPNPPSFCLSSLPSTSPRKLVGNMIIIEKRSHLQLCLFKGFAFQFQCVFFGWSRFEKKMNEWMKLDAFFPYHEPLSPLTLLKREAHRSFSNRGLTSPRNNASVSEQNMNRSYHPAFWHFSLRTCLGGYIYI